MTDTEFLSGLTLEKRAFAQNIISQRDDTLTRIDKATTDLTKAQKDAADNLKKVNDDNTASVTKLNQDHSTVVNSLNASIKTIQDESASKLLEAQQLITVLGGTELGKQMAAEKALQEKLAKKLQLETELAKLSEELK